MRLPSSFPRCRLLILLVAINRQLFRYDLKMVLKDDLDSENDGRIMRFGTAEIDESICVPGSPCNVTVAFTVVSQQSTATPGLETFLGQANITMRKMAAFEGQKGAQRW
jgi:hypothetical protein